MPRTIPRSLLLPVFLARFLSGCGSPGTDVESTHDAGTDAAAQDASGASDAGADANTRDASVRDAAVRDAAVRDANMPDASAPEPDFTVTDTLLNNALTCPDTWQNELGPVLLVHGTGANAEHAWDWTYVPKLTGLGYDVCTIDLPLASWGSVSVAAEYVVFAIRDIHRRTDMRELTLMGHSQGTLEIRWALRYWPSLRAMVKEVIGLAGVDHGSGQAGGICSVGFCRPAAWQMRPSSALIAALNAGDETPGDVPYTSIFSITDTTAAPPTSTLVGATNVAVQDACPGREVGHAQLISDAAVFALVQFALETEGAIEPTWVHPDVCALDRFAPITTGDAEDRDGDGTTFFLGSYLDGSSPTSEPALPAYATP